MKKYRLLVIVFLIGFFGFGQEIADELPIQSPQTPTTSALGKFGEVQVNESTGLISPSIPLFDYDAGKMSLPITLSYSGNGVKVNQDPTWVGVNWNLNPSGVITRIVKDLPDELTDEDFRRYYSEEHLDSLNGVRQLAQTVYNDLIWQDGVPSILTSISQSLDSSTQWYGQMNQLRSNSVDSEHDIFNYNFLDYSGSFIIDENNEAHLIKYNKEVNIIFQESDNNKSEIIIKTPTGDTYFFGGTFASESSKTFVNTGAGSTHSVDHTQNSFYLYRISFLNGGAINFQYENYDTSPCNFVKIGINESAMYSAIASTVNQDINNLSSVPCNRKYNDLFLDTENIIRLTSITNTFNSNIIEFNSTKLGSCHRLLRLNEILLKNENVNLKRIDFDYLTIDNETDLPEDKFFLEKVNFFGSSNLKEYDYEMEYTNPHLFPSKLSFAQDDLGYYNGHNENTTLLTSDGLEVLNQNCHFGLANREASINHSIVGSLQSIKYPTGGKTSFEYELPYKGFEYVFEEFPMEALYENDFSREHESSPYVYAVTSGYNVYCNTPNTFYLPISGDGSFTVTTPVDFKISIDGIINGTYSHDVRLKFVVHNLTNGLDQIATFTINDDEYAEKYFTFSNIFHITANGEYAFRYSLEIHHSDSPNSPTSTKFISTLPKLYLPTSTRDIFYPGLRIKNVINIDDVGEISRQRYFYGDLDHLNQETYSITPKHVSRTYIYNSFAITNFYFNSLQFQPVLLLSANSIKNVFNEDSSSHTYKNVTVSYGGDNFERGGKELTFVKNQNSAPSLYKTHPEMIQFNDYFIENYIRTIDMPGTPFNGMGFGNDFYFDFLDYQNMVDVTNNDSFENTALVEEKLVNSSLKKVKETKYNYEPILNFTGYNILTKELILNLAESGVTNITRTGYLLYKTKCYNYRLKSTETKEYFGEEFDKEVVSTINYSYTNDKVSLPSEIQTSNSKGEDIVTKIYYPSDCILNPSLTSNNTSLLTTMQNNKHNVAEIVKTENFINGNLIETKEKLFDVFGSNLLLPSAILTKKANLAFEERINFLNYSPYGSPTLVKYANGMLTKYQYNSRQQLEFKYDNFDSSYPIDDGLTPSGDCFYHDLRPRSLVTRYMYDNITFQLIKVVDPRCYTTFYEYDNFGRLFRVKDADGKILSENQYHYKP